MTKAERDIKRKLRILSHGRESGNVAKTCRYFGVCRETYYHWKRRYENLGEQALINSKPCPENPKLRTPKPIEDKVVEIRKTQQLGQQRISWYLERYHGIKIAPATVRAILVRNGLSRLPKTAKLRTMPSRRQFKRYSKTQPGHHVQIDVKFLSLLGPKGQKLRRFQYTAVDDATRIRAPKVYHKHTQDNAIKFVDYVIQKFPFHIHSIRTDNGHEFQAKFHWHVEDQGIKHVYIKPGTPRLNGKVERSHRTDDAEFYQHLRYKGDIDLQRRLAEWEELYNFHRPHTAHDGKTPFEVLRQKLS